MNERILKKLVSGLLFLICWPLELGIWDFRPQVWILRRKLYLEPDYEVSRPSCYHSFDTLKFRKSFLKYVHGVIRAL